MTTTTKTNLFRELCDQISSHVLREIKDTRQCSDTEAEVRWQHALSQLFDPPPDSDHHDTDDPPASHKKRPPRPAHGTPMQREFTPAEIADAVFEQHGRVYRRYACFGNAAGSEIGGRLSANRVVQCGIYGYRYPRSHIVWLLHHGRWPRYPLFHVNFDRQDDRIANLQEYTRAEINRTSRVSSRNIIGVKGVSYDPSCPNRPYRSSICRNGVHTNLGAFATASAAHAAYVQAAKEVHGYFNPSSRLYNE